MKQEPVTKNKEALFSRNPFINWLVHISVRSKFSVILGLIILILLFGLGSFWFGMKVMSSIRSYVGGEGLWSKAQKEAENNLLKYSNSFDESDYNNFLKFLQVPLGDKKARLELEKENPDLNIAGLGFIEGGNSPNDVSDLIFLYRRFRYISYMEKAIQIWTNGDAGIVDLMNAGDKIHIIINNYKDTGDSAKQTLVASELSPLVKQTFDIDQRLTILENDFSATLGEASRSIKNILLWVIAILTIILGGITLGVAYLIEKIIIQVDKAKSEFVFMASHQLRTPPTSMKWFLEMLRSGEIGQLNEKQKEYIEETYKSNQRMITLINMLLNASKIELGAFALTPKSTDIPNLVHTILKEYKLQIEAKKIIVTEIFQKDLPLVIVDDKLIYIVLQNIILNAIKYTPANGKINIGVFLKHRRENIGQKTIKEDSVIIRVSDNGYGIPKNESSKVFSKLFRASNVRKKDTDGTGLGLYLSKSIMDNMHGNLWFESEINVGTTFYIVIPII